MPTLHAMRTLAQLIRGIRVAMLSTAEGGEIHTRPMAVVEMPFDGTLWFFTRRSAVKMDPVRAFTRVNVTFADPDTDRYVSMSGLATIVRDPSKNRQLWSPSLTSWFPGGPEDRDLALMKIHVDAVEYWDSHRGMMVRPPPEDAYSTVRSRMSTARLMG
jgi:general stress protein 26